MDADVIVAGAGPAGGMAAYRLGRAGLRVLLLEKQRLPRHKPCGGGMTPVTERLFDWDVAPAIEARVGTCRYKLDGGRVRTSALPSPILMVDRAKFDRHVVEQALATGRVELREGVTVEHVAEDAEGVTVNGLRARFLVGADGAQGRTARLLGMARPAPAGIAIDAELEVDPEVMEAEASMLTFDFACVRNGYGWTFPKAGTLSCGVGSWDSGRRLPEAMDAYLARSLPDGAIRKEVRKGHPIPLWAGHQRIASQRCCLVGDAASLVDPITGEGIRFALASGIAAAEAIAAGDCRAYQRRIDEGMGRSFEALRTFVLPIFLRDPEFFYRQFYEQGISYGALARAMAARTAASAGPSRGGAPPADPQP